MDSPVVAGRDRYSAAVEPANGESSIPLPGRAVGSRLEDGWARSHT